jgi:hypothetical protein
MVTIPFRGAIPRAPSHFAGSDCHSLFPVKLMSAEEALLIKSQCTRELMVPAHEDAIV